MVQSDCYSTVVPCTSSSVMLLCVHKLLFCTVLFVPIVFCRIHKHLCYLCMNDLTLFAKMLAYFSSMNRLRRYGKLNFIPM